MLAPVLLLLAANLAANLAAAAPTFHKDVLPILQAHCQSRHGPGEIGPMPPLTYAQTRPHAKAIQAAASNKMPPWFAERSSHTLANNPSLTAAEIDTLAAWNAGGEPEGRAKDAPAR